MCRKSPQTCITQCIIFRVFVFFSSRRRHTRYIGDWSSDVCSSDLLPRHPAPGLLPVPLTLFATASPLTCWTVTRLVIWARRAAPRQASCKDVVHRCCSLRQSSLGFIDRLLALIF